MAWRLAARSVPTQSEDDGWHWRVATGGGDAGSRGCRPRACSPMKKAAVEGVLIIGHKGLAVEVPFDPAAEWGAQQVALWPGRRGYPVEVLLNGVRFRSAIVSRMRRFFVLVDDSMARRAGSRVGEPVRLTIWSDGAYAPKVTPPSKSKSRGPRRR
jgi:hypothetical protein